MGSWENAALQYGMAGIIFVGFICTLKWVFDINSKILSDMAEERKLQMEVRQQFAENIKEISQISKDFHAEVRDAHKYQRDEHKEMIDILGRINGYKNTN